MKIAISPLYSSSKGNCTLVCTENTAVLTDLGGTLAATAKALESAQKSTTDIKAVLITHEHSDHIRGVGAFSRRFDVPVYATAKTWDAMEKKLGEVASKNMRIVDKEGFYIDDIEVMPLPMHHDAADPVGYAYSAKGKKVGILTDTGKFSRAQLKTLSGATIVLLESNHDERMLECSKYPYYLKRRILSTSGHLSNIDAAVAVHKLACENVRGILLSHLSQENNFDELAYSTVRDHLLECGIIPGRDISLGISKKFEFTGFYAVK